MEKYYAHIAEDGRTQTVEEHLHGTSRLAADFARAFDSETYGELAGAVHDLGKYTQGFQRRLQGGPRVDHSSAGAAECARLDANLTGCCVAGHHGGLPDFGSRTDLPSDPTYVGRVKKARSGSSAELLRRHGRLAPPPPEPFGADPLAASFWCRMLYSCLVDADFLDTESFMEGGTTRRGVYTDMASLLEKLTQYTGRWKEPTTELNRVRNEILCDCIRAGGEEKGLFSLTVPTGGGKTVSSLAFALHHAVHHKMDRIIYVIPYTSIIEQNAEVFRQILGDENVVEHHSEAEFGVSEDAVSEKPRAMLATENWDAPVIVTTAVQFFESMFSNKPSRCRKLHNIANSVIVFDEAQMLPSGHLRPCVAAIGALAAHFNATAVLCTATQPTLDDLLREYAPLLKVREICADVKRVFSVLERVRYKNAGRMAHDDLCEELAAWQQVLCIVNTRKRAQEIYSDLPREGRFHLSTLMYPVHRQEMLAHIRERLRSGQPCRVVSTSLIEAGVDVDFPAVYRELTGLDSIVQAAGRCNREGKRAVQDSTVTVFEADGAVPQLLKVNIGAAREAMAAFEDIGSPPAIERYFRAYRSLVGSGIDKSNAIRHLTQGISGCLFPFDAVAKNFRMIESDTRTVYIPCAQSRPLINAMVAGKATKETYRLAGRYGVNVYEQHYLALLRAGDVLPIDAGSAYLVNESLYSVDTGLSLRTDSGKAEFI